MKKITFLLFTILPMLVLGQDVVYDFNTDGDLEGFTQGGMSNLTASGGIISNDTWAGGFQQLRTPAGLNLVESDYTLLGIRVENSTDFETWQVVNYDTGSTAAGQGALVDFTMPTVANGTGFTDFIIAIPVNPDNSGTIDRIGIRAKGTVTTGILKVDKWVIFNVSPENIVTNGDFESGLTPWTSSGPEANAALLVPGNGGGNAGRLELNATTTSNNFLDNVIYDFGAVQPSQTITVSFDIKSNRINLVHQVLFETYLSGVKTNENTGIVSSLGAADTWETISFNKPIANDFDQIVFRYKLRQNGSDPAANNLDYVDIDNVVCNITPAQALSNNDFKQTSFVVYPNPAQNVLNIKGINTLKEVTLYDLTGKLVLKNTDLSSNTIDLSNLKVGIYMVRIIDEFGNTSTQKIMKN
ncbi:T9SS type A sorting domain-containing protein [Winogradskyella litorisediminis]|uniref:T9SS type A sorting domain-containing protein n=1 Tax=Winogradskyella litorisediminis TaxID=1156618 RepID=A0ABW3N3I3_9FLAO